MILRMHFRPFYKKIHDTYSCLKNENPRRFPYQMCQLTNSWQTPHLRRRKQPFWFPSQQTNLTGNKKSELGTHKKSNTIHTGKLTWNLKIAYLKRKIIFQTFTIVFHVNFQGCRVNHFVYGCLLSLGGKSVVWFLSWNLGPKKIKGTN